MAPLAFQESRLSPLEEPIVRGHMEVWSILKDHIEMTVEMKLEQLYQMIVSSEYQNREQPHTEFEELLSSLPVESVTGLNVSSFVLWENPIVFQAAQMLSTSMFRKPSQWSWQNFCMYYIGV